MSATTDSGKEPVAVAAKTSADTYHWIDEDTLSLCGVVFGRHNERQSKEEGAKRVCRGEGVIGPRPTPDERPAWKRWDSPDDVPDDYNECGMCQLIQDGKVSETRADIVADIRELTGLDRDADTFNKDELRALRELLRA